MTVGGLFYEGKSNITIIAASLWSDRTFSSDTGVSARTSAGFPFLLFQFEFGGGTAAVGIIIIYVVSCLVGGFMAGKIIRKDRYIWGIVTGLSYYALLLLVSFLAQGKWDMTFAHALTTFFMCLGGGAIGGMLS